MGLWSSNPFGKPDAERPFCTPAELDDFRRRRAAGSVTFFREAACSLASCGKPIPNAKRFCSKECAERAQEEAVANDPIVWQIDVRRAHGRKVKLETLDGVHRGGVFGGVVTRPVAFLGIDRPIPVAVILAGDEIPLDRVRSITYDG